MLLYILRHGVTEYNRARRLQGVRDIPLSAEGREQARRAGLLFRDIPFDLCLTSPLIRARETAQIFLSGREVPIQEEPLLKEICFGTLEGRDFSSSGDEEVRKTLRLFFKKPSLYPRPQGGENLQDVTERAAKLIERLEEPEFALWLEREKAKSRDLPFWREGETGAPGEEEEEFSLLLSTHACISRGLLQCLPGSTLADYWRGEFPPNCSLSCIRLKDGKRSLLFQDRTA